RDISQRLAQTGAVRDAEELARHLIERERLGCTGVGSGIALPHCKLKNLSGIVVAIGRCPEPVDFLAPDGTFISVLFLVLAPRHTPRPCPARRWPASRAGSRLPAWPTASCAQRPRRRSWTLCARGRHSRRWFTDERPPVGLGRPTHGRRSARARSRGPGDAR